MASTYLTRTIGTQTLNSKFTISVWVKRAELSSSGMNAMCGTQGNGSHATQFFFDGPSLRFYDNFSSTDLVTTRKFRDTNAWYHVVAAIDTSQSTSADRVKIYVNGTQETSFATSNYPGQGDGMKLNISGNTFFVGTAETTGGSKFGYFDGCMSHFHFIDGTAYAPTVFGSTDSTTGEWKINTNPSVTYGNNGFFILKDAGSVTDQSGNSNNFTVGGGTLTNTEDNPSNVFNVLNILTKDSSDTLANGNLKWTAASGAGYSTVLSTLGFNTGKYYAEAKIVSASTYYPVIGIASSEASSYYYQPASRDYIGQSTGSAGLFMHGDIRIDNSAGSPAPASYTTNDIVGLAVDLDSATKTLKIYKNGTLDQTYTISAAKGFYHFACSGGGTTSDSVAWNFGNGFFATTAISSEGTNASNLGKFEYDVPAGYTALCTKGLNE